MPITAAILPEFELEMTNTRKMLTAVTWKHESWKPHEKSLSLGTLATHIAELAAWLTLTLNTGELDFAAGYKPYQPTSTEDVLDYFDRNVAEAKAALSAATDEHMMAPWSLKNGEKTYFTMPRVAVIRSFGMNHLYHHRGQLSVYLRLLNVPVPQSYGPTADFM